MRLIIFRVFCSIVLLLHENSIGSTGFDANPLSIDDVINKNRFFFFINARILILNSTI